MASLIEILLSGNFKEENISLIKKDIETCSLDYRKIYTQCSIYLESLQSASIEANILKGVGTAGMMAGKIVGNIPLVRRGPVDEFLQDSGEKLKNHVKTAEKNIVCDFGKVKDPETSIFVEKMNDLIQIYSVSRYGAHKKELDIYIPSLKIGIEYDGLRYHTEGTLEKEKEKDDFFKELGIQVFRLKERKAFTTTADGFSVWYRPWDKYKRLNRAIELLFESVASFCNFELPVLDIDIERDNAEILSLFLKKRSENGFAVKHPELLKEWHPTKNGSLDPWLIAEKSNQKFWWKCMHGHEWFVSVNDRVSKKTGCPVCGKKKQIETYRRNLVAKKGALIDTHPFLAAEWLEEENLPLTPAIVTAGSNKKVYWKCRKCGHVWMAYISNRTRKGQGCPLCRLNKTTNK